MGEDNNATLVSTFAFQDPKNRLNMMVGGVWADSCLVTANLNGDIFQLQQGQPCHYLALGRPTHTLGGAGAFTPCRQPRLPQDYTAKTTYTAP